MGMMLSLLGDLPNDAKFYVFLLRESFDDGAVKLIEDSFSQLAGKIGPDSWVVKGIEPDQWFEQVGETYLGPQYRAYEQYLPALLVTDSHPEKLTEDSLRLFIPVRGVEERFGSWPRLLTLVTRFVKGESKELIEKFEKIDARDSVSSIFGFKPSLMGISLDFGALYKSAKATYEHDTKTPHAPKRG